MKIAEELAQREEVRPQEQKKWDQKWRIIMFDVWERRRKVRDELRETLKEIGFVKVQDSAWAYPYPCEKLLIFLRIHLKLGHGVLYIVADEIEHDEKFPQAFQSPVTTIIDVRYLQRSYDLTNIVKSDLSNTCHTAHNRPQGRLRVDDVVAHVTIVPMGLISRIIGTHWPWFNRMTYRPFKGAHRGYWYRLPWNMKSAEYSAL